MNEPFYSLLVRVCLTTLAITLAFYGGLVVYLGQMALEQRQAVIANLGYTNTAVQSFSDFTEPNFRSAWTIPLDRESNARYILSAEDWVNSPEEILNPIAARILSNCSQALEWDQEVMDWLVETLNVTHFPAHYNLVRFDLHDLVHEFYCQFPPPPANYSWWELQCFVRSDFPQCAELFFAWTQQYDVFFKGITKVRSQISSALQTVSEMYADHAKLSSQQLAYVTSQNDTNSWHILTLQEEILYYTEMSSYYTAVFDKLRDIHTLTVATTNMIEKHDQFFNLAFHSVFYPVLFMAIAGVVIPMTLVGVGVNMDSRWRLWGTRMRRVVTALCILVFVICLFVVLDLLWQQIIVLYIT